ncbi:MAG: hypothetical protein HGA98_02355 [Deltaproteobacteria bacterium]|nr:hypothetical protein [Deltaproteobacteria bacterium]
MTKRQFYALVAVTAVTGFLGGAASDRLFSASRAEAAKTAAVKAVTAQEFRLLDPTGAAQVRIGFNKEGLATVFWNYKGKDPNFQGKEQSIVIATLPGFAPKKP